MGLKYVHSIIVFSTFQLICLISSGQEDKTKVEILHADAWKFDASVNDMQRLIGNVRLRQGETYMYCDSAWMYDDAKRFEAFSRVRIEKGDSLRLVGDLLTFDSNDKMARLRKNIRFSDQRMNLNTQILDYNLENETGSYVGGGVIKSSSGDELKSREGIYYAKQGVFHFRKNVTLNNPDYQVSSDTLHYYERTSVSRFYGPTTIVTKDAVVYCERGYFNSDTEQSEFIKNAKITNENNILSGDSIIYSGKKKQGHAFGGVEVRDSTSTYFIRGERGFHDETADITYVTRNALLLKPFDKDTLYLHADTLRAMPEAEAAKRILAYRNVRFFKNDLQGRADSLVYADRDSLITMHGDPVLWNRANQITGETIRIRTWDSTIDRLLVDKAGRIMSEAMPDKYNQIAGRQITGFFEDNEMKHIHVSGNAETIYFPTEKKGEKVRSIGLNGVKCSTIDLLLEKGELSEIRFKQEPVGSLKPNKDVGGSEMLLPGMIWRSIERPKDGQDVFNLPAITVVPLAESNTGPRVVK